jgi:hypothetical protein
LSLLQNSNAIETGGYAISNSLRFQSANSTYLARTPSTASNRKTWTWSGWIKRGALSSDMFLLSCGTGSSDRTVITMSPSNDLAFFIGTTGLVYRGLFANGVLRDPAAWYHLIVAVDTTQAVATNRANIYINGVLQNGAATSGGNILLNQDTNINTATAHNIGRQVHSASFFYDGYLTELNFIDGQQLTPSSFGETDATTGQWVAKKYTGTYGTNGFYLPFSNGTSTTTLGADSSGNGNNWTLNNFTRSAGVSDCWMIDVPSGNGGASGTQPSANYAVLNPIDGSAAGTSISNSNLKITFTSSVQRFFNLLDSVGKCYAEFIPATSGDCWLGLNSLYRSNGTRWNGSSFVSYGASYTSGDVIGCAFDFNASTVEFFKNGVSQGSYSTSSSYGATNIQAPLYGNGSNIAINCNFGQRSFAYTPPTGFKALCTANLPEATIKKGSQFMDALLWTGNGTSPRTISGYNFSPDFIWTKNRSAPTTGTPAHFLYDTVRGAGSNSLLTLDSSSTAAEFDGRGTQGNATDITSNGITFTSGSTANNNRNENNVTYVAWAWDAGSSTVTNTNGTISSQVRANPNAGVSVITYTGTFVNATVGHGLGIAPSMIIVKRRDSTGAWPTYHSSLSSPETGTLYLNTTNARVATTGLWNSTLPTSNVINIGQNTDVNASGGTYVAYCFSEIAGFSKFGSYTGNGSADGPFVYTGFRPKFVMVKNSSAVGNWVTWDSSRDDYNVTDLALYPNLSNAESTGVNIDILSNGFKVRDTSASTNASTNTMIYMAFAESPFSSSNAR